MLPVEKTNKAETCEWRQQDQCSTSNILSAPPVDTHVGTLGAISNNNFFKDLDNRVSTNSSTKDKQLDHFLLENPSH